VEKFCHGVTAAVTVTAPFCLDFFLGGKVGGSTCRQ
jgi:hypothetical protein